MSVIKKDVPQENISLAMVEASIDILGWFHFGKKEFECSGLDKQSLDFYKQTHKLPYPCDKCYKALIFWNGISEENLKNFFKMLSSFEVNYRGKLNQGVVVFYFRDKKKMLEFLDYLQPKMQQFNVKGRTQWRRACKEYQDLKPELWKNAKEFIPDMKSTPPSRGQQQLL
jgi:hypothetical protein